MRHDRVYLPVRCVWRHKAAALPALQHQLHKPQDIGSVMSCLDFCMGRITVGTRSHLAGSCPCLGTHGARGTCTLVVSLTDVMLFRSVDQEDLSAAWIGNRQGRIFSCISLLLHSLRSTICLFVPAHMTWMMTNACTGFLSSPDSGVQRLPLYYRRQELNTAAGSVYPVHFRS